MAIEINGKTYRNIQEQVQKNKDDIEYILEHGAGTTVVPSTQRVEGAPYVYSLNIEGDDYNIPTEGGGGGTSWGSITGNLSDQTDLYNVLNDFNERILNNGSEIEYLHTNKANQIDLETETDNRQRADQEIMAGLNEKSTVIASTQAVAGADTIHSINIDNIDYNLPEGGGTSGSIYGGTGITVDTSHSPDVMISIDEQVVATTSALQDEITRAEGVEGALEQYCDNLDATKAAQSDLTAEANARSVADTTLQTNIDNETSARHAEVDALQGEITAEANTREANDNTIINTLLGGKKISVVSELPASPDVNTIYFITGA